MSALIFFGLIFAAILALSVKLSSREKRNSAHAADFYNTSRDISPVPSEMELYKAIRSHFIYK